MKTYDAVVIGAGHNGLAAAVYLARAGWDVLVLERNAEIGGAIRSGEMTRPGFVHDLYSTNHNVFRSSPVYRELQSDLERHGLQFSTSSKPFCNVFPDGGSIRVYQDEQRTLDELRQRNPRDAEGWQQLYEHFKVFQRALLPLYQIPLPSLKAALVLAKALPTAGLGELLQLAQLFLASPREIAETYFASEEARALFATWGLHLDLGPDVSGGTFFPFVETFTNLQEGISIVQGGASNMPNALAGLIREHGGEIRTDTEVRRVLTSGNRATGVELVSGEQIGARRAVIANLAPTVLFGRLLDEALLPPSFRQKLQRYTYGPGTMMVHLALRERPPWAAGADIADFGYVHIAPTVNDLARTYTASLNGYLPDEPLLIVGQTSAVDPSRTPNGEQILWIQVRTLPRDIQGDMAGEITARNWDEVKEPFGERVIRKLEKYAPGIRDLILYQVIYSPADLERSNPNLVGGDSVAGSHHLRQNFLFRPFPGWSRYQMPLEHLWMVGAATWPGGGNNATSGYLAAQALLRPRNLGRWALGGSLAAGTTAVGIALARGRRR